MCIRDRDKIYPTAEKLVATAGQGEDAIGGVANAAQMLADNGLDEFNKSVNEAIVGINNMQSDIEKLTSGTATTEDLTRMAQEYQGFAELIGKSTDEQVTHINNLKSDAQSALVSSIDSLIDEYNEIKKMCIRDRFKEIWILFGTESNVIIRDMENRIQDYFTIKDVVIK